MSSATNLHTQVQPLHYISANPAYQHGVNTSQYIHRSGGIEGAEGGG